MTASKGNRLPGPAVHWICGTGWPDAVQWNSTDSPVCTRTDWGTMLTTGRDSGTTMGKEYQGLIVLLISKTMRINNEV